MANPDPEKVKRASEELEKAFFEPIDEEEAERITASLPLLEFDITKMKPGDVVAIHFPTRHPKSSTSE